MSNDTVFIKANEPISLYSKPRYPLTLGSVVRPKILTNTIIYNPSLVPDFNAWWRESITRFRYQNNLKKNQFTQFYNKHCSLIFQQGLDRENYAGIITMFIGYYKEKFYIIDDNTPQNIKNQTYLVAAGIRFYKTATVNFNNGEIVLENSLQDSLDDNIWFYFLEDINLFSNIILYESLNNGDCVYLKNYNGFILETIENKRKDFWSSSSWTSQKKILFDAENGRIKLGCDKQFIKIKSDEDLLEAKRRKYFKE